MEEKKLGKNTKKCEGYKIKQKDLEKMILFTKEVEKNIKKDARN